MIQASAALGFSLRSSLPKQSRFTPLVHVDFPLF